MSGRAAPKTVDEYISQVPEPGRSTLNKIRETIRSAAPKEAIEVISYGMPAFRHKGALVYYGAFADHCSFFPGSAGLIKEFENDLKSFSVAKGTIRFPLDKPLPSALIKKIVKARVEQNELKSDLKKRR